MKLAENICNLRKSKGLSQEKLAEKVNVSRQTISNWELGETSPNPEQLLILSEVFLVSVDELLGNEIKSETKKAATDNTKTIKLYYWGFIIVFGMLFGVLSATANRFQLWEISAIAVAGGVIGLALAAVINGIIKIKK